VTLLYPLLGLAVAAGLITAGILGWRAAHQDRTAPEGTRLANTGRVAGLASFQNAIRRHRAAAAAAAVSVLVAGLGTAVLAARPAEADTIIPEMRNRDVVLCLDVSGSMFPVDAAVVRQFREIVGEFDGERVAMSWFNSSSVTLFPLTDDYEFIEETLGPIQEQFDAVSGVLDEEDIWDLPDDLFPDTSGTLMGEGSSLPGDGLVSCLQLFDNRDKDRPRSIILATDNMLEGTPIFGLGEAAAMATHADVRVYALCPEDYYGFGYYEDETADEFAELRRETESTGGAYYAIEDSRSVRGIVDDILEQEAALADDAPVRVVHDRPLVGLVLFGAGLAGVTVWGGWRSRPLRRVIVRRGGLVLLAAVMVWNPTFGTETFKQSAVDADVFILVDTSPSIAAEDWDVGAPRLDGVREDVKAIVEHHAGAHFSLITFDTTGHVTAPLTSDPGAATSAADTLEPITTWYAAGSSVDACLGALTDGLERSEREHPERARLVYYLGDGEQTAATDVESFAYVEDLVDGGAVLGYGTEEGGPMREHLPDYGSYFEDEFDYEPDGEAGSGADEEDGEPAYIDAPDGSRGVSRIDESTLKMIASELGVGYSHRDAGVPVSGALWSGKLPEREIDQSKDSGRPLTAWLALAAAPLIAWEMTVLLRRWRRASQTARLAAASGGGPPGTSDGPGGSGGLGTSVGLDGIGGGRRGTSGRLRAGGGLSAGGGVDGIGDRPGGDPPWGTGAWR
jgi:hypothetical protein